MMTGGIVAGLLADRLGKRDVLASTILLYSIGSLIAGLAPTFPVFLFGRAVVGLGVGGEWSIGTLHSKKNTHTLLIWHRFNHLRRVAHSHTQNKTNPKPGHALVAESVDPRMRGRASAMLQAGEPVGVVLAALLGYLAMPRIGWRWIMVGLSATGKE